MGAADGSHGGGQQLNGGGVQHHQTAQLITGHAAAALRHSGGGTDAQWCGGVAQPQKIGGDVGAESGQCFAVAAGVGQDAAQQRTKQTGKLFAEAAAVHQRHNAAPQADGPCHGKAQLYRGLRAGQGGGRDGGQLSCGTAEQQRKGKKTCQKVRHRHIISPRINYMHRRNGDICKKIGYYVDVQLTNW